jgi:AcrR family transcriptional regulator
VSVTERTAYALQDIETAADLADAAQAALRAKVRLGRDSGATIQALADRARVTPRTIYRWLDR